MGVSLDSDVLKHRVFNGDHTVTPTNIVIMGVCLGIVKVLCDIKLFCVYTHTHTIPTDLILEIPIYSIK